MTRHELLGDDRPGPEFQDNPSQHPDAGHGSDAGKLGFGAGVGDPPAGSAGATRKKTGKKPARKPAGSRKRVTRKRAPAGDDAGAEGAGAGRKKHSRRRRADSAHDEAPTEPERDDQKAAPGPDGEADPKRRRRRGSRGGRRRRKKEGAQDAVEIDVLPGDDNDLPDLPDEAELVGGGKKKRRRRRSRRKPTAGAQDEEARAEDSGRERAARKPGPRPSRKKAEKKSGSKKKAARKKATRKPAAERTPEEIEAGEEEERTQLILVNAIDPEEKRVAVVEDERILDLLMTSDSHKTLVNDIYRGRVVNLEPAIGAAFIDFGQGRNGFLHTSDVLSLYGEKGFKLEQLLTSKVDPEDWDEGSSQPSISEEISEEDDEAADSSKGKAAKARGPGRGRGQDRPRRRARERRPISELLSVGDPVVVQVTKDAIGDKGPTLTTYISIPGRYLVLMPSMARTGVSRKIPDDKERRRLKRILTAIDAPEDMGVIVRTAGVGKTKKDLRRDLDYLLGVWENFGKRLGRGRGPAPLYQESNVAIRTLRDLFAARTKSVLVDDPVVYEELMEFAKKLMPDQIDRIHQYEGERPIFHHYGLEQEFEKIFARRVELPSGGSIVFDQAEALVAIDVNSGRTRTKSFDFEEIALKTNLEAVPEIARQIRLRDLGGILVCDFIDMMRSSSNRLVERALRGELAGDRARSKLGRVSQFGLLEMTRQRLGPGTHKNVFQACPRCRGTARIRTVPSRAQAILRRLGSALTQKGFSTIEVRTQPEVVDYLRDHLWDYVRALEHRFEKEVDTTGVQDQPEDSVLRYLRADGREVRPGGRRKR